MTSVPGSSLAGTRRACGRPTRSAGFTLIELLIVVALIAMASSIVSLALRDPAASRLEQEAVRLSALLEAARAEARASGLSVRWEPAPASDDQPAAGSSFRFVGLPAGVDALPTTWLHDGVTAQVQGARAVPLGPEPVIGPQRIVLRLHSQALTLGTDGLAPFGVASDEPVDAAR